MVKKIMKMNRKKSISAIGSRTRTCVKKGKSIRLKEDGMENFEDYWSPVEDNSDDSGDSDVSKSINSESLQTQSNAKQLASRHIMTRFNYSKISNSQIQSPVKNKDKKHDQYINKSQKQNSYQKVNQDSRYTLRQLNNMSSEAVDLSASEINSSTHFQDANEIQEQNSKQKEYQGSSYSFRHLNNKPAKPNDLSASKIRSKSFSQSCLAQKIVSPKKSVSPRKSEGVRRNNKSIVSDYPESNAVNVEENSRSLSSSSSSRIFNKIPESQKNTNCNVDEIQNKDIHMLYKKNTLNNISHSFNVVELDGGNQYSPDKNFDSIINSNVSSTSKALNSPVCHSKNIKVIKLHETLKVPETLAEYDELDENLIQMAIIAAGEELKDYDTGGTPNEMEFIRERLSSISHLQIRTKSPEKNKNIMSEEEEAMNANGLENAALIRSGKKKQSESAGSCTDEENLVSTDVCEENMESVIENEGNIESVDKNVENLTTDDCQNISYHSSHQKQTVQNDNCSYMLPAVTNQNLSKSRRIFENSALNEEKREQPTSDLTFKTKTKLSKLVMKEKSPSTYSPNNVPYTRKKNNAYSLSTSSILHKPTNISDVNIEEINVSYSVKKGERVSKLLKNKITLQTEADVNATYSKKNESETASNFDTDMNATKRNDNDRDADVSSSYSSGNEAVSSKKNNEPTPNMLKNRRSQVKVTKEAACNSNNAVGTSETFSKILSGNPEANDKTSKSFKNKKKLRIINDTIVLNSNAVDAVKPSSKRPIENLDKTYEIHETVQSPMKKHKKNANVMNITHNPADFDEDPELDNRPELHHKIKRKKSGSENKSASKLYKKVKASKVLSNNLAKENDEVPEMDHDAECGQNNYTHKINETNSNVNAIALSVPTENNTEVIGAENELSINHKTKRKKNLAISNEIRTNKEINASKNLYNQPTENSDEYVSNKTKPSKNNNDLFSSQQKKKGRKKNKTVSVSDETIPVRKSTRQRYPPLASWRMERLLFRSVNGVVTFVGVDPGLVESRQQVVPRKNQQKEKKERSKKMKVLDVVQKRKKNLTLIRRFDSVPWEFEDKNKPYNVKKCFDTVNSSFGYLEIKVNEEKPLQYIPEDDMYFSVMKGNVQINIQDNITVVKEKDAVVIPRCIPYSIKNIGTVRALLVYCVSKFHFMAP